MEEVNDGVEGGARPQAECGGAEVLLPSSWIQTLNYNINDSLDLQWGTRNRQRGTKRWRHPVIPVLKINFLVKYQINGRTCVNKHSWLLSQGRTYVFVHILPYFALRYVIMNRENVCDVRTFIFVVLVHFLIQNHESDLGTHNLYCIKRVSKCSNALHRVAYSEFGYDFFGWNPIQDTYLPVNTDFPYLFYK